MHLSCARAGKCGGLLGVGVHVKANQFHRNRIYSFTWPQKEETACTARALSLVSTRCVSFGLARGIGQECAHGDPTYTGVPGLAMRENLPQFWTTPLSEASTHATQKHWCGAQISKVTKYSTHRRTPHRSTASVCVVPKSVRLTLTHVARPYDVHMLGTTESVLFIGTRFKWIRQPEPRGCVHDVCMFAMKHNTRRNEAQHTDVVLVLHIHQRHPASSLAPGTWCHRFSIQAGNKHT